MILISSTNVNKKQVLRNFKFLQTFYNIDHLKKFLIPLKNKTFVSVSWEFALINTFYKLNSDFGKKKAEYSHYQFEKIK